MLFVASSMIALGAPSTNQGVVFAIHNDVGHDDKLSLGECYRELNDKDSCQEGKDSWKEARESNRGPPEPQSGVQTRYTTVTAPPTGIEPGSPAS